MTTSTFPFSLVSRVVEAVRNRGTATVDDMVQDFPGETRKALHAALSNARDRKVLRVKERGHRSRLSVWEETPEAERVVFRKKPEAPVLQPVASVFDLAYRAPWQGQWPPGAAGRRIDRLGPWNVPEQLERTTT